MRFSILGLAVLFCMPGVAQVPKETPSSGPAIVEIDGVKLTFADVERKRPSLFQARNAFYEAQRKTVEDFIDDYLLERQAQKENTDVAKLLELHVNSQIEKDPSEESLRVYYEGIDTTEPFEAVRSKIVEHLRARRIARAKAAYVQSLRKQAVVSVRLPTPRTDVSIKDTPVRGRKDAGVVLIEYADYECTYCQQIQPSLDKLLSEYKDRIAFAYKDVPLPMHPNAQKAAEATHCAGVAGKYWEYHDLLFSSRQLDVAKLKEQARQLKLDGAAFDTCLDSGSKAGVVQGYLTEAQALGLQGTPSFFINGRFFSGIMTYEKLREIVEEELVATTTKSAVSTGGQ